jgi:hypothetical protein
MESKSFDVKSKGELLGTVDVMQYDTLNEIKKDLEEEDIVNRINRSLMEKAMNSYRSERTRSVSPLAKLTRLMGKNEDLKKKVMDIIEEMEAAEAEGEE